METTEQASAPKNQPTLTADQKKLLSDAYQHVVDSAKLLGDPALLEVPNVNQAVDALKNAEKAVGWALDVN